MGMWIMEQSTNNNDKLYYLSYGVDEKEILESIGIWEVQEEVNNNV